MFKYHPTPYFINIQKDEKVESFYLELTMTFLRSHTYNKTMRFEILDRYATKC